MKLHKILPIVIIMQGMIACTSEKAPQPQAANNTDTVQAVPDADQINYYMVFDSIADLRPDSIDENKAMPFDGKLTVAPGIYKIGNEVLNMNGEGLYRALIPFKQNYQVIVYRNDVAKLMSSLSWIITHGTTDDNLPDDPLLNKAMHDKVYISCERACVFARNFLSKYGISSRIIQGRAIDKPNGFDEGHILLEVMIPETRKWTLFDLDNNAIFREAGKPEYLNLLEFKDALENGTLEVLPLSIDKKVDISQFKEGDYSFSFYSESITASNETLIKWYKRILGVVLIDNHYYNAAGTETLKKYSNSCVYLDKEAFRKKFY